MGNILKRRMKDKLRIGIILGVNPMGITYIWCLILSAKYRIRSQPKASSPYPNNQMIEAVAKHSLAAFAAKECFKLIAAFFDFKNQKK